MAGRTDQAEFEAAMRSLAVEPIDRSKAPRHRGPAPDGARTAAPRRREPPEDSASAHSDPTTARERDEALHARDLAIGQRDEALRERDLSRAELEREQEARARLEQELARATDQQAELRRARDTEQRGRRELEQRLAAIPSPRSLRQLLTERGAADEAEMTEIVLALLTHSPVDLLDELAGSEPLAAALGSRLSLVCERPECQPTDAITVVHVPPERCDVCGGSSIRAAWELLLRRARLAGVTRIMIVGGSPQYRAQLKSLHQGSDLRLELVSGRSKPSRRRARTAAERVVIWGATILDHATSAAFEAHGERLIHVQHRGISGMLHEVAARLDADG
ncbi:MAG: hypothetical protein KC501_06800 [Myxococcales bacterium]|nr:hypothetical protein [Myxococcales bacterium]